MYKEKSNLMKSEPQEILMNFKSLHSLKVYIQILN